MPAFLHLTKFFRLLQTFSPAELKDFETWLQSPWCNTNKNLIRLLERLKPHHPDFSDTKLTKEKLFQQVLPNGKFSERRMNNLLSEAYLAAEQFFISRRLAGEHSLQQELLAQEFQNRGLDDYFFRTAYREIDYLEAKEAKDWKDYLGLFRMRRQVYNHPNQELRREASGALITDMGEQLDLIYLLEKAAIINEKIFRKRLFKEETYDVSGELKQWQMVSEGIRHPSLDLYHMRFEHTEEDWLLQYFRLQAAFMERFDALNERDQKIHLLSLLNDAKLLIKSGSLDITESLPLYQLGLKKGAILNQGKLSANTYMTIVTASNTKGSFDFSTHFMDTYTSLVAEDAREDCVHWAKAHTAYWQKDLEVSLAILQAYHFRAPNFQLISRVLHSQVYFDLYLKIDSYQDYLFSFFDTFEKWLNREKVWSKSNKASFLRFVQVCRTLARYYADPGSTAQNMERLLKNEHNIQALNWLKQKKEEVVLLKANRPFRV